MQNQSMKTTKKIMSERLEYLMRVTPSLDTLKKVAARSGVSYGTVQRIRTEAENDVGISNVEDIAKVFGLTLIQFISENASGMSLEPDEFELLHKFRALKASDKKEVTFFASIKAGISNFNTDQDSF